MNLSNKNEKSTSLAAQMLKITSGGHIVKCAAAGSSVCVGYEKPNLLAFLSMPKMYGNKYPFGEQHNAAKRPLGSLIDSHFHSALRRLFEPLSHVLLCLCA